MNCYRRFVQLEMRIVSDFFIHAIAALPRSKVSCISYDLAIFIFAVCPILKNVILSRRCGRSGSGTGSSLNGFRSRINATHTFTIACDCVMNSYILLFPLSQQSMVGSIFVCGDLCRFKFGCKRTILIKLAVCVIVENKHCTCNICRRVIRRRCRLRDRSPTLKCISGASRCCMDIYSFVNLKFSTFRIVQRICIKRSRRTVILIPIDMRRSSFINLFILSTELNRIVI